MSADGDIVAEQRLEKDRDKLDAFAREYAGSEVAIEASGSYRSVYDILGQEIDVTPVNPSKTRVIAEAKVQTDSIDAKMLAHVLRTALVTESYVPPEDVRQARDLVRARKSLVKERTAEKNRVQAVQSRTENSFDGDLFGKYGRAFLDKLDLSTVDQGIIEAHIAVIDALNEQIERLERTIEEVAGAHEDIQRRMLIPGVRYFTSLLIKSEIGDIDRFPSADQLVSYEGRDPSVRQSEDKEIRSGITKKGSAPLCWALVQCSNVAARFDEYLGIFHTRLEERKNHKGTFLVSSTNLNSACISVSRKPIKRLFESCLGSARK